MILAVIWKTGELFSVYLTRERLNTVKSFNQLWNSNQCFLWHPKKLKADYETEQAFAEGKYLCDHFLGACGGGGVVWCFRGNIAHTCIQNSPKQISKGTK